MKKKTHSIAFIVSLLIAFFTLSTSVWGAGTERYPSWWTNQEVYIPILSAVFAYGSDNRALQMSANIIIGNRSFSFDSQGKVIGW